MRRSSTLRAEVVQATPGLACEVRDLESARDRRLVQRVQAGDEAAFAELFQKHRARVFAIARSYLRDPRDAEDVVQETFLRVHRGLGGFQGASTFLTWVHRIATNLAIDELRKPRREVQEQRVEEQAVQGQHWRAALECAELASDPLVDLRAAALRTELHHCIDLLPSYHRDVIVLRELHGQSYAEMSAHLGVSIGTVMSRLFHARQKLQRVLLETYVEHFGVGPASAADQPITASSAERPRVDGSVIVNVVPSPG